MADSPYVLYEPEDTGIAWIRFNRPERMNAIAPGMVEAMNAYMDEADNDPNIRVIVLTGVGRSFCAGADLKAWQDQQASQSQGGGDTSQTFDFGHGASKEISTDYHRQSMSRSQKRTRAIRYVRKPTIGMINGPAVGMGLGIATYPDIRIGCEHARFFTYKNAGQIPEQGECWNLPRIIGISRALEFLYTGGFVEAEEAYRWGLLNKLVPCEELEAETRDFCQKLISTPPLVQWIGKSIMWRSLEMSLDATLDVCATAAGILFESEDAVEARRAWREKRVPIFKGR